MYTYIYVQGLIAVHFVHVPGSIPDPNVALPISMFVLAATGGAAFFIAAQDLVDPSISFTAFLRNFIVFLCVFFGLAIGVVSALLIFCLGEALRSLCSPRPEHLRKAHTLVWRNRYQGDRYLSDTSWDWKCHVCRGVKSGGGVYECACGGFRVCNACVTLRRATLIDRNRDVLDFVQRD